MRYRYYAGGPGVDFFRQTTLTRAKLAIDSWSQHPNVELVRVMVLRGRLGSESCRHEVIRGGRWVSDWHGLYGRHKDESREWRRRGA